MPDQRQKQTPYEEVDGSSSPASSARTWRIFAIVILLIVIAVIVFLVLPGPAVGNIFSNTLDAL
jgi:hypothetical protein